MVLSLLSINSIDGEVKNSLENECPYFGDDSIRHNN